jgi:hypothetical protein
MADTQDTNNNVETTPVSTPDTTVHPSASESTQNDASALQQAVIEPVAPPAQDVQINPTASQHENDISVQQQQVNPQAPQVIVSNPPTAAPVSIAPIQSETTAEQVVVNGEKEVKLQNQPTSIHSVTVNGNLVTVSLDKANQAVGTAVYDLEKNALVFANEVSGVVSATYAHVPELAQADLARVVASLHDRLSRVEALVKRWEGANL